MLTYEFTPANGGMIWVLLNGSRVGLIRAHGIGYRYSPKRGESGETFPTIVAVKRSLEVDVDDSAGADADREMFGDEAAAFGLKNIGCK